MNKKRVFITPKIINSNKNNFEYQIDTNWFKYFKKLGFNLELIDTLNFNSKKKIDLVIFSGGNDLFKKSKKKENFIRDFNEKKILKHCLKNNIKILGICRGFQLIADFFNCKVSNIDNHVRKNHNLILNNNSYFTKEKFFKVNSFHNYGLIKLTKDFNIISWHSDKSIEIAEHKNKKILCFMFHPERKNLSQKLINNYIINFMK